ncbi:MAG: hypothetical protein CL843_12665 [Crocinitomicaceae bacterium]|nr:hypothetical protein [Crocinitomicaceae bacterium]|tara:strand:- start:572 stop:1675 length:1104 start_codon:yes stop_codon:yes gene_type:complete
MKHLLTIAAILFSLIAFAHKGDKEGDPKKDTVTAVVVYGEEMLLSNVVDLPREQLIRYKDSLATLPTPNLNLISQIELYLKIPELTFDDVFHVIDSLFELEEIPYPLINQINWYVARHEEELKLHEKETFDTSAYPADFYYHDWNTDVPNPYKRSITVKDSTLQLPLVDNSRSLKYVPPIEGIITSGFGWRDGRNHNGIDIDLEVWDTVKTCFSGMVRVARWYGSYGRVVVVRHYNGLETIYAHLHRFNVNPGQIVNAGDVIGLGGSSGRSTGSHLHWEIRFKGVPIDPKMFIDFDTQELMNDTLVLKKTAYGYAAFPEGAEFHTVKKGEFLFKIAHQYGVSISHLCQLNGIRRNQVLYVGQKLRVI